MENIVELKNISKAYEDNIVLDNFNLEIRKNEFLTLLGPSGCGKTTTLKIIAGFEFADEGQVVFEGKEISDVPRMKEVLILFFKSMRYFLIWMFMKT